MNITQKLTSRKLWVAVAGLVAGIITLVQPGTDTSQITGVILALGSVVAYIVGEGLVDAAAVNAGSTVTQPGTTTPTESGAVAPDTTGAK